MRSCAVEGKHSSRLAVEGDSACNERIGRLATNMLMTDFSVKQSFLTCFAVQLASSTCVERRNVWQTKLWRVGYNGINMYVCSLSRILVLS